MKKYLERLPAELKETIKLAAEISRRNNMPAYLVGGFVRDLILGVNNLDLDISVEGDGIIFAEQLAQQAAGRFTAHKKFGTATVFLKQHLRVDIASARREVYACPGSLPQVSPSSLEEDLRRRDFTINAMAIGICGVDYGRLIDLFGGKGDLRAGRLRILHDLSFIEDPTRIFRAVRFEQRYAFRIEPHTLKLLRGALRAALLNRISPQRIRHDFLLILKEAQPLRCIRRLERLGVLSSVFGSRKEGGYNYALLDSCRKQVFWFAQNYPQRRKLDSWLIYLMAVLDGIKRAALLKLCCRLDLRRGEEKRLLGLKKITPGFINTLSQQKISPARIYALLEPLSYEAIIFLRAKYNRRIFRKHLADFLEVYNQMRLYISGHDLHGLGVKPGPQYKKVFAKTLAAKLNGKVRTREQELGLIRKLLKV